MTRRGSAATTELLSLPIADVASFISGTVHLNGTSSAASFPGVAQRSVWRSATPPVTSSFRTPPRCASGGRQRLRRSYSPYLNNRDGIIGIHLRKLGTAEPDKSELAVPRLSSIRMAELYESSQTQFQCHNTSDAILAECPGTFGSVERMSSA